MRHFFLDLNGSKSFLVFGTISSKGVVFEDDNLRYYVFIKDYLINGSISPLEMEQEKIKNVLLNKNKIEYLKQLEDELYQNGLALKKIKIY